MPLDKKELESIKADFGVGSRRLYEIYNEDTSAEDASLICEAANKADAAYEALTRILEARE